MGKQLVYKTKEALADRGFFDKPTLRAQRLKPGPKQPSADRYWQGRGTVNVYDIKKCVPMRRSNYVMTPARAAALQKARSLIGTVLCSVCSERIDTEFYNVHRRMCFSVDQKRLAERDLAPLPAMPTVYLDTETTGLHAIDGDEILELCICDDDGLVIINSLVKPTKKTEWPNAQAIHGITQDDVKNAPNLADLMPQVRDAIQGKRVVIYNAKFDVRFFPTGTFDESEVQCCMLRFAKFVGDWNEYRRGWRWHKLVDAADHVRHEWMGGKAHRAHVDTLATKSVWNWMQSGAPQPEGEYILNYDDYDFSF